MLEVRDLHKHFPVNGGWRRQNAIRAVDGVSFSLRQGEVLAVVGASGCGKTTLALTLLGLEKPTSGQIFFHGKASTSWRAKALRRELQMVFQDPYGALNPLQKVGEIIAEPLRIHRLALRGHERHTRVLQALEEVGLRPPEAYLERRPHELSGGQRQRVIIASALVLEPSVLIADEPVTMLDPAMRAEILSVLAELRRQRALSILLISHDLDTVAALADRVAVMSLGRIVELGTVDEVLKNRLCLR